MSKQRLNKNLILGQDEKSEVLEGKGEITTVGNCIWCDKVVWASSLCYTIDKPQEDESLQSVLTESKALHKFCLLEIIEYGKKVMFAVEEMRHAQKLN